MPEETPPDSWPTPEDETVVRRDETLVGAPPPPVPPGAPPPVDGPPPDRRIGAGMLLGLGVLALVAAGIVIAYLLTHNKDDKQTTTVVVTSPSTATTAPKVTVPRLVGLKEQDALVRLGSAGLRPKEVFKPTKAAKGLVVSQSPEEATELARGAQVTLVIDSGAPKVAVPDVTGTSFEEAQASLDKLGLNSTKTEVTSAEQAGTVVDQAPKAGGSIPKGSTVTLSVAKSDSTTTNASTTTAATTTAATTTAPTTTAAPQPQSATMPDVVGQKEAAAVTAMGGKGILASIVFVPSSEAFGSVVEQAKPSGTTVPFHSHVQINISRGSNNDTSATVPNVVGQTLQQAVGTVNGAHLRLIYLKFPVTSQAQAGKVVQQSPLQGAKAPENGQVVVYLGAYKKG